MVFIALLFVGSSYDLDVFSHSAILREPFPILSGPAGILLLVFTFFDIKLLFVGCLEMLLKLLFPAKILPGSLLQPLPLPLSLELII